MRMFKVNTHWAPNTDLDVHTHNFDAEAVVTEGELWLTCDSVTRHLTAGDTFAIGRQVQYAEPYGSQGATCWVARRNIRTAS